MTKFGQLVALTLTTMFLSMSLSAMVYVMARIFGLWSD